MRLIREVARRSAIVIGGGPVGSATAAALAAAKPGAMLVHNPNDRGSHDDKSRLIRLALEENDSDYNRSFYALQRLFKRNQETDYPFIDAKPGVLFAATAGTQFADKLMANQGRYPGFRAVTAADVAAMYPKFGFNFPEGTAFWHHPEGYTVNPVELSKANIAVAESHGCEVLPEEAALKFVDKQVVISAGDSLYASDNIYLLTGARNKEVLNDTFNPSMLASQLDSVYLTAISARRYSVPRSDYYPLMPIIVGRLELPDHTHPLDFSVMPEGKSVVKVRLSGLPNEEIEVVADKYNFPEKPVKQLYDSFFGEISHVFRDPIDFGPCITYRNRVSEDPLDYLAIQLNQGDEVRKTSQRLFTTLSCGGVHVRYALSLADKFVENDTFDSSRQLVLSTSHANTEHEIDSMKESQVFRSPISFFSRSTEQAMIEHMSKIAGMSAYQAN